MTEKAAPKETPPQPTEFVTVGEILGAWGLKGAFRIRPTTDFPERFDTGETVYVAGAPQKILSTIRQKDGVIITVPGVDTPEAAAKLRGKLVEIPASALKKLPKGRYYHFDIVGLEVVTTDGAVLGKITDILNCGNDVYVVKAEGKKDVLIPATRDVVKKIDLEAKKMVIEPIEGLLG